MAEDTGEPMGTVSIKGKKFTAYYREQDIPLRTYHPPYTSNTKHLFNSLGVLVASCYNADTAEELAIVLNWAHDRAMIGPK